MSAETAMKFSAGSKRSFSGRFPDYGAIFMSNGSTMLECFDKKIFGLPTAFSDFVRRVKSGMILFLFDYETRRLYGVFKATTNGGINIVPEAYSSSGKQFSAQVRITTIWNCYPLSEYEFHDAIKDNYYCRTKFKFGLSKDQVYQLLLLFDSRKARVLDRGDFTEGGVRKRGRICQIEDKEMEESRSKNARREVNLDVEGKIIVEKDNSQCLASKDMDGTCEKPEMTPSDFHSLLASGTIKFANYVHELCTHLRQATQSLGFTSGEKPGNLDDDLGDFIPLLPLDDSDLGEIGNTFSETGYWRKSPKKSSLLRDYYRDLSLLEPYIPPIPKLAGGELRQNNTESLSSSIFIQDTCHSTVESSAAINISSTSNDELERASHGLQSQGFDCQKKYDLEQNDHCPIPQSLYPDSMKSRTSVFSRLNLSSKDNAEEEKPHKNTRMEEKDDMRSEDKAVGQIMQELHQSREKWNKSDNGDSTGTEKKRTSVFLRLG